MTKTTDESETATTNLWKPRFRLGTLLIVFLVLSVMSAAVGYFVRSMGQDGSQTISDSGPIVFLIFTLAAPMLLMIVVSLGRGLVIWMNRPRRRKSDLD